MKAEVFNLKNEKVDTVELPERVFGAKWNPTLIAQVIEAQLSSGRRPWAHAKGRGEVRGGGRKPWRQKGTGRARHGSIRSPIWKGGGKSHGPVNSRDYSKKINKKMKVAAMFSSLSHRFKEGNLKFLESLELGEPKTRILAGILGTLLQTKKDVKKYDALLIANKRNRNLFRAVSNLPKAKAVSAESINTYDILNHKRVFIDRSVIDVINRHYKKQ
ncbi:MAG: 50S ribosomal protein L4 [Patescibacteria group bacterium]